MSLSVGLILVGFIVVVILFVCLFVCLLTKVSPKQCGFYYFLAKNLFSFTKCHLSYTVIGEKRKMQVCIFHYYCCSMK